MVPRPDQNAPSDASRPKALRDSELLAMEIVGHVMPGAEIKRRDLGGTRMHDFDLLRASCAPIALEVTEATVEGLLRPRARVDTQLRSPIRAPSLERSWAVNARVGADIRQLKREVVAALGELEREWRDAGRPVTHFFAPAHAHGSRAVARLLELGVDFGAASAPAGPARVSVWSPSGDAEWTDSEPGAFVQAAVEREAEKEDNVRKLAQSGSGERHLFVVVDRFAFPPWRDLDRGSPSPVAPKLPDAITTAWAATRGSGDRLVAWCVSPPRGWEVPLP